jgi:Transposase DDE domain group 1
VVAGERQEQPFQLSFNGSLRVDFQGARVTSDGGLLLVRELDERLEFGELIERHLTDGRGKNTQLPLIDLVRQSMYSRLAAMRMSTTPNATPKTRPSGSSAPRRSCSAERR